MWKQVKASVSLFNSEFHVRFFMQYMSRCARTIHPIILDRPLRLSYQSYNDIVCTGLSGSNLTATALGCCRDRITSSMRLPVLRTRSSRVMSLLTLADQSCLTYRQPALRYPSYRTIRLVWCRSCSSRTPVEIIYPLHRQVQPLDTGKSLCC
jgi:hypothetical protein